MCEHFSTFSRTNAAVILFFHIPSKRKGKDKKHSMNTKAKHTDKRVPFIYSLLKCSYSLIRCYYITHIFVFTIIKKKTEEKHISFWRARVKHAPIDIWKNVHNNVQPAPGKQISVYCVDFV